MLELFEQLEFVEDVLATGKGNDEFMAAMLMRAKLEARRRQLLARLDEMEHAMEECA